MRYGVTMRSIRAVNGLPADFVNIQPGESLVMPVGAVDPADSATVLEAAYSDTTVSDTTVSVAESSGQALVRSFRASLNTFDGKDLKSCVHWSGCSTMPRLITLPVM